MGCARSASGPEAQPLGRPGPEALHRDVGAVGEPQQRLEPLPATPRSRASERLPALAEKNIDAAALEEARPPVAGLVAAPGMLDLDDVGSERAEDLGRGRPCERARQVEHADSGKRPERHLCIIATRPLCDHGGSVPVIVDAVSGSNWSYLIVFVVAMLDAFFPIVPSEATAIAAGVVAGTGDLRVEIVILAASLGAILGDNISFALGHFFGARVERRFFKGEKSQKRLQWAQQDARRTRRLPDRRRALHPGRPHRDDVHCRVRRDFPGAGSSSSTRSRA